MFCQKMETRNLHNVATMDLSNRIILYSKKDRIMRIRLAHKTSLQLKGIITSYV